MGRVAIMCLKVMVVVVAMLQLSAACRRRSKQATCTYDRFKHCAECPVPPLQCAACGRDKVMSSDKQKCLVCPSNCQTCVYNNEKTRAECATCNDGYALNSANTMCTAVSGCDGSAAVLTAEEGTFGINKTQYKDYMKCGWIIIVDTSQIIKLAFITFSVEYSNDCNYDNVRVHDGMGDSAKLLGKYCGTTIPSDIISSNDHLFVSFKTDKTVTEAGFKIRYSAIHRICSPNCDSCASNGAGKCDASHCHARYALDPTSNTCQACSGNCHTCARPGICNSNGCDPQYTLNTTTDTCTVCPVNCEKCSYNARQDKIECDICISRLAVNVMKTCSACAAHCKVCSVSGPGKCDPRQCDDAYKFFYSTTTCGVCAPNCLGCTRPGQCDSDKCSNGYVFNVNDSTCIACAAHCRKCVATGGGFCDSGNCATGYTLDAMGKICTPCASDCMVCNTKGPGKCDKGQCSRRYARNPSTDTCVACPSDCEVCSFNPSRSRTECKECFGPRGVSSGESCSACAEFCHLCFENGAEKCDPNQCFVGYTLDAANTCTECPPDCATCRYTDDKTECTHCYGSFGVAEDKTCAACDPNCDGCANNGAGKCDSNQCNDRYIFDDASKTCKPCPRHCSTCKYVNNAAECRKCDDLFGIKADNKTCGACSSNCDGCATSGAGKCDSGKCHNHYALDGVTETCKPCSGGLENCNDCSYNAFVCVSCVSPFELNSTNQCSGETANVLHGGPLMTVYATTASVVVYLVTGLVV